jgi:hypothetical protein
MHGGSLFERAPDSTAALARYRFELTGSTGGKEWASAGLLISGAERLHYVVCASPLANWRERQKVCDQALRSFVPGDLTK